MRGDEGGFLIADGAEPKSCADYRAAGLPCRAARKGPGSLRESMKWLQSLAEIVIDPARCPEKFKKQYEEELAAKRAEKKKKRSVTVEENGQTVTKEVSLADANKLRLELARKREAELHKDERTTPLNKEQ